jgi:hypothetical protein
MSTLQQRFALCASDAQDQILRLGFLCWDVLQEECLRRQDVDLGKLMDLQREEGRREGKRAAQQELKDQLNEKELQIDTLSSQKILADTRLHQAHERLNEVICEVETRLRKEFDQEKEFVRRETVLVERQTQQEKLTSLEVAIAKLQAREDWQQAYERERQERESLFNQLQELKKQKTSFTLGKEGEAEINNLLSQIPEWDFTEVHQEKGKADFRAVNKEKKTFILDAKNYSKGVPKAERDKIARDVDADTSVLGGLLVSLNSKVHTKEHCEIELTSNKKPICYLVLEGMSDQAKCICISSTLRLLLQYVASQDEREKNDLVDKIQQAFLKLGEIKSDTENQRNKAKELYDSLKVSVDRVQTLLHFLQDKSDKESAEGEKKKGGRKKNAVIELA